VHAPHRVGWATICGEVGPPVCSPGSIFCFRGRWSAMQGPAASSKFQQGRSVVTKNIRVGPIRVFVLASHCHAGDIVREIEGVRILVEV